MAETKKKKHRLKKEAALPHFEGDFDLVACDLSMRCPGFALLRYSADDRSVSLLRKDVVANNVAVNKPHGKILNEIGNMLSDFLAGKNVKVAVRERAFTQFNAETQAIHKVVGVSDMIVWHILEMSFQELAPSSVKKYVTGWGMASKDEVAEAIDNYIPKHTQWHYDDESDAVAVGLSWLIKNGYIDCVPLEKYKEKYLESISENDDDV